MLPDWRTQVTDFVEYGSLITLALLAATLSLVILLQWVIK
jgi:hypothetical protein